MAEGAPRSWLWPRPIDAIGSRQNVCPSSWVGIVRIEFFPRHWQIDRWRPRLDAAREEEEHVEEVEVEGACFASALVGGQKSIGFVGRARGFTRSGYN